MTTQDAANTSITDIVITRTELQGYTKGIVLPTSINTDAEAEQLIETIADVEDRIRKIEERISGPKKRARAVWQDWCNLENETVGEARKFATDAREMLKDYQRRVALEAKRLADERAQQEQKEAEERALADAAALEALAQETGDQSFAAMADSVISNVPTEVAPIAAEPKKLAGMKSSTPKKILKVKSLTLLLAQVVAGRVPATVIKDLDMRALAAHVKATGIVPAGCVLEDDVTVSIARKK